MFGGVSNALATCQPWDDGGSGTNWNTAANWDNADTAWSDGNDAVFSAGSAANLNVAVSALSIDFNNGGAFDILAGGGTLTVSTAAGIQTLDGQAYSIAAPVTLGITQAIDVFAASTQLCQASLAARRR